MSTITLAELTSNYRPGSFPLPWSWDDEEHHLHSLDCPTEHARAQGIDVEPCDDPAAGCYQRKLEAHAAEHGITQGVCLGSDGRVWDGHHRVVAARRLGIETLPVEP